MPCIKNNESYDGIVITTVFDSTRYRRPFHAMVDNQEAYQDILFEQTLSLSQPESSHDFDISSNAEAGQGSSGNIEPTDESHS